jgi:hypothetical protein
MGQFVLLRSILELIISFYRKHPESRILFIFQYPVILSVLRANRYVARRVLWYNCRDYAPPPIRANYIFAGIVFIFFLRTDTCPAISYRYSGSVIVFPHSLPT